jgi:hypothetical protein
MFANQQAQNGSNHHALSSNGVASILLHALVRITYPVRKQARSAAEPITIWEHIRVIIKKSTKTTQAG